MNFCNPEASHQVGPTQAIGLGDRIRKLSDGFQNVRWLSVDTNSITTKVLRDNFMRFISSATEWAHVINSLWDWIPLEFICSTRALANWLADGKLLSTQTH